MREKIVKLFTQDHLTYRQIAAIVGRSHSRIGQILKEEGIDPTDGTWVDVTCYMCSNPFKQERSRVRKSSRNYCSRECYYVARKTTNYKPDYRGQRMARKVVSRLFALPPGSIVHHEDGDNNNNDPRNLKVFASHSDHLKYHHGINRPEPIWDGSKDYQPTMGNILSENPCARVFSFPLSETPTRQLRIKAKTEAYY